MSSQHRLDAIFTTKNREIWRLRPPFGVKSANSCATSASRRTGVGFPSRNSDLSRQSSNAGSRSAGVLRSARTSTTSSTSSSESRTRNRQNGCESSSSSLSSCWRRTTISSPTTSPSSSFSNPATAPVTNGGINSRMQSWVSPQNLRPLFETLLSNGGRDRRGRPGGRTRNRVVLTSHGAGPPTGHMGRGSCPVPA
jgi:hypothetical protein